MYRQVSQLQRQGLLAEACALAESCIQDGTADINLLRIYGMVMAEMLKQDAERCSFDAALNTLQKFSQSPFSADEIGVYHSLVEAMSIYIQRSSERPGSEQRLNKWFDLIQELPIHCAGFSYILLIKKVLKLKGWNRLGEFAYWCGISHLRAEDYVPFVTTSGNKIMSLAEQLSIRIAKYLIETRQEELIVDFIPQLKALYQAHPDYTYPPYFLTQLYLLIDDHEQAHRTLIPFVRKKSRDFWVWQLMAEIETDLSNQVVYYAKAIQCGSRKEEMLVSLYEDAAKVMVEAKQFPLAKWLVDRVREIRYRNKWRETDSLRELASQSWYATAIPCRDTQWLQQQADNAEILALGGVQKPRNKRKEHAKPAKVSNFRGKLRIAPAGYGFVHDDQLGDIYVPIELVATHCSGDMLSGQAREKFDKKKQRMSFVAQKIN